MKKRLLAAITAACIALMFCACVTGSAENGLTKSERRALEKENIDIARSYRSIYRAAEKGEALSVQLDSAVISEIIDRVAREGLTVSDSAGSEPMRNRDKLSGTLEAGEAASVFLICPDGGFLRYDLAPGRDGWTITVSRIYWDGSAPELTYAERYGAAEPVLSGDSLVFDAPVSAGGGSVELSLSAPAS